MPPRAMTDEAETTQRRRTGDTSKKLDSQSIFGPCFQCRNCVCIELKNRLLQEKIELQSAAIEQREKLLIREKEFGYVSFPSLIADRSLHVSK